MITDLYDITMTGRFCYAFMCIEKYLITIYPEVDWTPIAKKMWQWTTHFWDDSWDVYSEIVPDFILEFPTYEETNKRAYDGELDKSDYEAIVACYKGITNGNSNDEINRVIHVPIEMGNECEGSDFSWAEPRVQEWIDELEKILISHDIEIPSKEYLTLFRYDRNPKTPPDENPHRWGDFVDTEYLSIIL